MSAMKRVFEEAMQERERYDHSDQEQREYEYMIEQDRKERGFVMAEKDELPFTGIDFNKIEGMAEAVRAGQMNALEAYVEV
jgi:hypothetical protein